VRTARVVPFDVNGRRLGSGFDIRGLDGGRAEIRAIAVDEDRRLWAADAAGGSLRAFTVSGAPAALEESREEPESDRPGAYGDPGGLAAQGLEAEARLLLSRRGSRRHGLLLIEPESGTRRSLVPDGDPQARFEGLAGVALAGRFAFACESVRGTVQVFRDGDFHFRLRLPDTGGCRAVPRSVAALTDGRSVVACEGSDGGAVFLFDAGGGCVRRLAAGAAPGSGSTGEVENPSAVVVVEETTDRSSLALILDRDGERVQAFTLQGACLGGFHDIEVMEAASPKALRRLKGSAPGAAFERRPARD